METHSVDVVITDYTMPNMNGIDVLQAVAAQWPTAKRLIQAKGGRRPSSTAPTTIS